MEYGNMESTKYRVYAHNKVNEKMIKGERDGERKGLGCSVLYCIVCTIFF